MKDLLDFYQKRIEALERELKESNQLLKEVLEEMKKLNK